MMLFDCDLIHSKCNSIYTTKCACLHVNVNIQLKSTKLGSKLQTMLWTHSGVHDTQTCLSLDCFDLIDGSSVAHCCHLVSCLFVQQLCCCASQQKVAGHLMVHFIALPYLHQSIPTSFIFSWASPPS